MSNCATNVVSCCVDTKSGSTLKKNIKSKTKKRVKRKDTSESSSESSLGTSDSTSGAESTHSEVISDSGEALTVLLNSAH